MTARKPLVLSGGYSRELAAGDSLDVPALTIGSVTAAVMGSFGATMLAMEDAPASRDTLGLGSLALQASDNVSITGGTLSGLTSLAAAAATIVALTVTGAMTIGDAAADTLTINSTIQPGVVIAGSSAGDALRITQAGAGNALVVEDAANPDATPFVINADGRIIQNAAALQPIGSISTQHLQIHGAVSVGVASQSWATWLASNLGSITSWAKSRGATVGDFTAVQNNDQLGQLRFYGADGTQFVHGASITAEVDGAPGANDMPTRLVLSVTPDGSSAPVEAMRVTSARNVLINTATDDGVNRLQVSGPASISGQAAVGSLVAALSGTARVLVQGANDNAAGLFTISGTNAYSGTVQTSTMSMTPVVSATQAAVSSYYGIQHNPSFTGATAWTSVCGLFQRFDADAAWTGSVTNWRGLLISAPAINGAATGTLTNWTGVEINDSSSAATIKGLQSAISAGAGKWILYCIGSAKNYIQGTVLIGTGTDDGVNKLQVTGSAKITGALETTGGITNTQASSRITSSATALGATFELKSVTGSADINRWFLWMPDATGKLRIQALNDAGSGGSKYVDFTRVGNTLTDAIFNINGALVVAATASDVLSAGATPSLQVLSTGDNASSAFLCRYAANTGAGTLRLGKSRAAAVGGRTIVQNNDQLGTINFYGDGGTNFVLGAQIFAIVDGTPGANAMGGKLVFATTADGASTASTRYTISSAGLHTWAGNGVISTNNSSDALRITQAGSGNALVVEDAANPDSTPFVIDASGSVVVGHTTALSTGTTTANLQLHGDGSGAKALALVGWANSATFNPRIELSKSRSGTIGTHTILQANDAIAAFNFLGSDGSAFIRAANITIDIDGTPALNGMPGRIAFGTTAAGASSPTEAMRINSAQRVLIGTTTDNGVDRLQINGGTKIAGDLAITGKAGFNGAAALTKPTITGSRGGNAALADLLTQLASYGLITDSTTA